MTLTFENLEPREFLRRYLTLVSALKEEDLLESEKRVLTEFLLLPSKFSSYAFSPAGKKRVLLQLGNLSSSALYSIVYRLIRKGYLVRDEDNVIGIAPFLKNTLAKFLRGEYHVAITFSLAESSDRTDRNDERATA